MEIKYDENEELNETKRRDILFTLYQIVAKCRVINFKFRIRTLSSLNTCKSSFHMVKFIWYLPSFIFFAKLFICSTNSVINSLFGSQVQRTSECSQCGAETTRDDVTLLTALSYPDKTENRTYRKFEKLMLRDI